jgi:hypothetical protein
MKAGGSILFFVTIAPSFVIGTSLLISNQLSKLSGRLYIYIKFI